MFRFSVSTLLLLISVISLMLAGLACPNELWQRIVGTTTLAVMLAATITVIAWQSTGRWFWVGFAVTGWSYLVFAFYGGDEARQLLLTDYAISQLDQLLQTSSSLTPAGERVRFAGNGVRITGGNFGRKLTLAEAERQGYLKYAYTSTTEPTRGSFHEIGHYAWALVLGCIGGMFSLRLYQKSRATSC